VRAVGSFVAIGDSFTEGYGDYYPDGSCQGWADRFTRLLAASAPGLTDANLASGFDPVGLPLMRLIRDKRLACNARIKDIAARHDCLHVGLWSMAVLADPREW
jgi:hypothetical protein